jgi:ABC-type multidrug transport system fused ATPase/permease subunit
MPENKQKAIPVWPTVRRLLDLTGKKNTTWLVLAILLDLVLAGSVILSSHLMRLVFDAVSQGLRSEFWLFTWATIGLALTGIPLSYFKTLWVGKFSEQTLASLRKAVAARTLKNATQETCCRSSTPIWPNSRR